MSTHEPCADPACPQHGVAASNARQSEFYARNDRTIDARPDEYIAEPICIDELVTVMGQHNPRVRWNGWLCPRIDAWSCVKVIEAIAREHDDGNQPGPTFEWDDDGNLIVTEYDGDTAYPETLPPDEDGLYSLGAWSWVWSRDDYVTDPDVLALLEA